MAGWKKRCSSDSCSLVVIPDASNTSALNLSPDGAAEFHSGASRPAAAAASRSCSSISVAAFTPAWASTATAGPPSRPPGAAPTRALPLSTGSPGEYRSSGVGTGSPRVLASVLATGAFTICV